MGADDLISPRTRAYNILLDQIQSHTDRCHGSLIGLKSCLFPVTGQPNKFLLSKKSTLKFFSALKINIKHAHF